MSNNETNTEAVGFDFCKDCRHRLPFEAGKDSYFDKCGSPKVVFYNPAAEEHYYPYCNTTRSSVGPCKPEGVFWESKDGDQS